MVKRLLTLSLVAFALSAQAQYQVGNSDFETDWTNTNEPGSGWYSFVSATGTMATFGKGYVKGNTTRVSGHNGNYAVQIKSSKAAGKNANGNLTTGMINMGAMEPTSSNNYNYTKRESNNCSAFTGHPDAFEYWAKFTRGGSGTYNARCNVIIHGNIDYRDPNETSANQTNYKIATATVEAPPSTEWNYCYGVFTYTDLENTYSDNTYVLASFTTNPTAGGSADDIFVIDDVKFVYWHALSALSFEGASLSFSENTTSYDLSSVFYDEAKLSYTVKGRAATASKRYNASTGVLTIRVEGEDFGTNASLFQNPQSYTEYTIQFKHKVSEKTYTEDLYVTLDGFTFDKEVAAVLVETYNDNTIDFSLNNFMLAGGPVGNIAVKNIAVASDNSFVFNGGIQITPGNVDGIDEGDWMGPVITLMCGEEGVPISLNGKFVDDDHIIVTIDINLTEVEGLNQMINVHLGYARATMAVNATAQYGTFCAPYDVTIPSGVTASKVTDVGANGLLTLTALSTTIPANTPVVLYAESGYDETEIFGVAVSATTLTSGLLTGVYTATTAPEGSYVLQNQDGNVAFYLVTTNDITVPANRCYLTTTAPVKALVFPDGTQTSISSIQAQGAQEAAIYDLSGRRVSKTTKGIYIINGKKVIK